MAMLKLYMLERSLEFLKHRGFLDGLLIATKLLGTLFAGVFGVLGLLTEYRDKNTNEITRWGRIALLGIIVSTIVAIASQSIETVLNKMDAKQANDRLANQLALSNNTLREVERAIFPIKDLTISYAMEVSLHDPGFERYLEKIKKGIQPMDLVGRSNRPDLGEVVSGGPGTTTIKLGRALLPDEEDGYIYSLFQMRGLNVGLYRQPFDLQKYFRDGAKQQPDLSFIAEPVARQSSSVSILYTVPSGKLQFQVYQFSVDRWHGNEKIASIPDLSGAQLIAFPLTPDLGSSSDDAAAPSPFTGLHVYHMTIQTGDRTFNIGPFSYQEIYSIASMPKLPEAPSTP